VTFIDVFLGKTVQMIATMVINMPDFDNKIRTTLVVVPAALLSQVTHCCYVGNFLLNLIQWKEELEQKTNDVFSVHIHYGKDKLKTLDQIHGKDVCSHLLRLNSHYINQTLSLGHYYDLSDVVQ
jgi:SNF2 family DNA or RNA helicase